TPSGRGGDHARVYLSQSPVLQITKGRSRLRKKATLKQNDRQGCRPPKAREVLSETLVLPDVLVKILQIVPHRDHELVGVGAVDNAVIVSQHQADDVTYRDGVVPIVICDDNRFFEDAAHA